MKKLLFMLFLGTMISFCLNCDSGGGSTSVNNSRFVVDDTGQRYGILLSANTRDVTLLTTGDVMTTVDWCGLHHRR